MTEDQLRGASLTAAQLHALRIAILFGSGSNHFQVTGTTHVEVDGERKRVWVSPSAVTALVRKGLACWGGKQVWYVTPAGEGAAKTRGISCDCDKPILHVEASVCEGCEETTRSA